MSLLKERKYKELILWCKENNLTVNIKKTKELMEREMERVGSFKFLSTYISEDLSWTINANMLVKKA